MIELFAVVHKDTKEVVRAKDISKAYAAEGIKSSRHYTPTRKVYFQKYHAKEALKSLPKSIADQYEIGVFTYEGKLEG